MGSLFKKSKRDDWVFQYMDNGKRIQITKDLVGLGDLTKEKRKKIKRKYEVLYEDNKTKTFRKTPDNSITQIVKKVLQEREDRMKMNSLSQTTLRGDRQKINYFSDFVLDRFGNISVVDIDQVVLNSYTDYCRDELGNNSTTINNKHKSVQVIIRYLLMRGMIKENPYDKIDLPKRINRGKDDIPNYKEYKTIKTYLDEWVNDYLSDKESFIPINVITYIQIQLGMRVGEVLIMKWKKGRDDRGERHSFSYVYLNSNFTKLVVHFKRKWREYPLRNHKVLQNLFKKIKKDTKSNVYVLEGHNNTTKRKNKKYIGKGKPLDSSYCSRPLKSMLKKLGVDESYSTHTLRHGFITDLIRKDVSLTKIGNVVGHSDIRMTELYGHLDTTDMESVLSKV